MVGLAMTMLGLFAFRSGFHFAVNEQESRRPAALPQVFNDEEIKSARGIGAIHELILQSAEAFDLNGSSGVRLGHFEVRSENGMPVSACQFYSNLEMTFVAGDMAVNGELPRMVVEGPCRVSTDGLTISPLVIQLNRVTKSEVKAQTMQSFDDPEVSATFINVSDSWPHIWVLNRVRLYDPGDTDDKSVVIEQSEIRERLGKNLSLNN